MCLIVNKTATDALRAAKGISATIKVYKLFRMGVKYKYFKTVTRAERFFLRSPHMEYEWSYGETTEIDELAKNAAKTEVNHGLHVCLTLAEANRQKSNKDFVVELDANLQNLVAVGTGSGYGCYSNTHAVFTKLNVPEDKIKPLLDQKIAEFKIENPKYFVTKKVKKIAKKKR